jgi:hypothetical protein
MPVPPLLSVNVLIVMQRRKNCPLKKDAFTRLITRAISSLPYNHACV